MYMHAYIHVRIRMHSAAEIKPKPSPGWDLPAAARAARTRPGTAGHPDPPRRCTVGMLMWGIGLLMQRTHMRMRMPGRECEALELNPGAAFVGAAAVRWPHARAAQRGVLRRSAAKPRRWPELPAQLRLQGSVCTSLHHRNNPTIH